jgi:hypothetical protein
MPQFEPAYKNRSKFDMIRRKCKDKLADFDVAYATTPH